MHMKNMCSQTEITEVSEEALNRIPALRTKSAPSSVSIVVDK